MRAMTIILLISMAVTLIGCETTSRHRAGALPPRPALINHTVYFKLKNPQDADELIADCDRTLAAIPGVVSYFAGKRLDTDRPNVDADFDVGFYVGFNSQTDYATYVDHPNHVAAVNKWRSRWDSIRIEDVIDATP